MATVEERISTAATRAAISAFSERTWNYHPKSIYASREMWEGICAYDRYVYKRWLRAAGFSPGEIKENWTTLYTKYRRVFGKMIAGFEYSPWREDGVGV